MARECGSQTIDYSLLESMILSDGEITSAIEDGRIVFEPALSEEDLAVALTTSALDLRLGDELQLYHDPHEVVPVGVGDFSIDPTLPGVIPDLVSKWANPVSIAGTYHIIQPGEFLLASTLERVQLPEDSKIAARVEGKSTPARLGLVVHMTAPTIHCGFRGNIVLEIANLGRYPIKLTPGMRICQLIFEMLGEAPIQSQSTQYQDQTGPTAT